MAATLSELDLNFADRLQPQPRQESVQLTVDLIDSKNQFVNLKAPWQTLYAIDRESGYFLSWGWISALFEEYSSRVRILAVRRTDGPRKSASPADYVALFPISSRMRWSDSGQKFQTILEPCGRNALSELTGILCDPAHEAAAIAALADKISALPWTRFSMRYEPTGRRAKILLEALPDDRFVGRFRSYLINDDEIDNLNCPQVALPQVYDNWLSTLSSNTRQKIRRFTRRHLESGEWHVSQVRDDTLDRDIEIVLDHWQQRWVAEKGRSSTRRTTSIYRHMMKTAHQLGALHLPILWAGETPLVAHGCIWDASRRHVHFVLSGRSIENDRPNSGFLLHCDSIRRAVEAGFAIYDFGHGDEAYKASLGGSIKRLHYLFVERRSNHPVDTIDPYNMSHAVRRIRSSLDTGKTVEARAACNDLLKIIDAHSLKDGAALTTLTDLEHPDHG
ncbi:MAG: GNAT family N-acetyltransferase [Rhizobiaceae bacterium]